MVKKLNLCLVGCGSIGRRHLRLLKERKDVEVCIAEPFEKSYERIKADFPDVKRYTSMKEAVENEKLDAVLIATPHTLHSDMTIEALSYGLNVFCEKPMSDNLRECVKMKEAVEKSGKIFSVGFMFHFDPFIQKVKEIIDSKKLGNILHYYSRFASYNTLLCSVTKHQKDTPYSVIMDCIHDSDLLYYLTGKVPDYAFSNAYKAGDLELSSPQNFFETVYRFKNGDFGASTHFNYVEHPQVHSLEIVGDKGYIIGDFMSAKITVGTIDGKVETIETPRDFDNVYRAEWEHFIKALKGEVEPENQAKDAIYSILLMYAQRESAEKQKEVDIRKIAKKYGFKY